MVHDEKFVLPNDTILFISGTTGVGKSTIARHLLSCLPDFLIIEEFDLIREAIRGHSAYVLQELHKNLSSQPTEYIKKTIGPAIIKSMNIDILQKSCSELNYLEMNKQCEILREALKNTCRGLRNKKLPAIIEGENISFEALFGQYRYDNYFVYSDKMIFINLYLSDEDEHVVRLKKRAEDRGENAELLEKTLKNMKKIRANNIVLHKKALEYKNLSEKYSPALRHRYGNSVHSLDTIGKKNVPPEENITSIVAEIIRLIKNDLHKQKDLLQNTIS